MKEEALKLAEELEDEAKYGECDWTSPRVSATMIRRLVKELDKKPLSDEEIKELSELTSDPDPTDFVRAIEERHGIK